MLLAQREVKKPLGRVWAFLVGDFGQFCLSGDFFDWFCLSVGDFLFCLVLNWQNLWVILGLTKVAFGEETTWRSGKMPNPKRGSPEVRFWSIFLGFA